MTLQLIENNLNNSALLKSELGANHSKYVISVLNEIRKTTGDDKKDLSKDLSKCTPLSIESAIKQACDLQLEIDGRQHCHLVKYNKNTGTKESPKWISEAQLQVGYRGFIYSIKRAYPDANIDCNNNLNFMAGLNHLKDIYEKKGKEFLEALLNKEVIVNEKMDGAFFGAQRNCGNSEEPFEFFKIHKNVRIVYD